MQDSLVIGIETAILTTKTVTDAGKGERGRGGEEATSLVLAGLPAGLWPPEPLAAPLFSVLSPLPLLVVVPGAL